MNKKLLISSVSDSDPPMFSFQKFYVNGTTATNITPSYGAFGNIELSIAFSDSWGTYNPPALISSFSVHNKFIDKGEFIPWSPSCDIWIEGRSYCWDPFDVGEATWNGQVWVYPNGAYPIGWTTSDYNKWGIIHCAWDHNYKPFEEWPKLSEIH